MGWFKTRYEVLKKNKLEAFRLTISRYGAYGADFSTNVDETDILKRMEFEFLLLQFQTQEMLIETMERSIKSQDDFSKTANFIGFAAIIVAAAQIFIALVLSARA